ncbi:uncharacterized protein EV422DRAFT_548667 [Fimicolochytrium jonesii]|uniref:uncharacterized protein n=1 Tax=Fimicolochytrium jonesii TaxID=1396493 RepID=UPI0022FE61CF|nr:uncharacterized protein EV422DRAFT_548667 [Fimicolochytrium jonesii]KAI8815677.1 hypothetical protein EV422DRAFT_548667 [Fimicolochytrium jonesii]
MAEDLQRENIPKPFSFAIAAAKRHRPAAANVLQDASNRGPPPQHGSEPAWGNSQNPPQDKDNRKYVPPGRQQQPYSSSVASSWRSPDAQNPQCQQHYATSYPNNVYPVASHNSRAHPPPPPRVEEPRAPFAPWIDTIDRMFWKEAIRMKLLLKPHRDEVINRFRIAGLSEAQRREVEHMIKMAAQRRNGLDLANLAKWDLVALRRHGDLEHKLLLKHIKVVQAQPDRRNRTTTMPSCERKPCLDICCEFRHPTDAPITKRAAGRAFRCLVGILLRRAGAARLIERSEIRTLKIQYYRGITKRDRRTSTVASLAAFILLADCEAEYTYLVSTAIRQCGIARWADESSSEITVLNDLLADPLFDEGEGSGSGEPLDMPEADNRPGEDDEEDEEGEPVDWKTLSAEKLYRKSLETMENPIIAARFCVTTCNVGVGGKKAQVLLPLWLEYTKTDAPPSSDGEEHVAEADRLTLPMLCYLFAHLGPEPILECLAAAKTPGFVAPGPNSKARQTPQDRINEIEQRTFHRAVELGLREECGKGTVRSLYRFCAGLLVELAAIFGEIVVEAEDGADDTGAGAGARRPRPEETWRDSESEGEEGEEAEVLVTDWRELCRPLSNYHLSFPPSRTWHRKVGTLLALLLAMSNALSHQDRGSDPELFLVLLRELVKSYAMAHAFKKLAIRRGAVAERAEEVGEETAASVKRALLTLESKIGKELGRDGIYVEAVEEGKISAALGSLSL